jgi:hypothetical protein
LYFYECLIKWYKVRYKVLYNSASLQLMIVHPNQELAATESLQQQLPFLDNLNAVMNANTGTGMSCWFVLSVCCSHRVAAAAAAAAAALPGAHAGSC